MKRSAQKKHNPSHEQKGRHLKLVPSVSNRKPLEAFYILFSISFFVFSGVVITLVLSKQPLGRHNLTYWETQIQYAESHYRDLARVYSESGEAAFQKERASLKTQVQRIIENLPEEKWGSLSSMIVYLYPELLPEEDFEKDIAYDLWKNLQTQIENESQLSARAALLDHLKASVWNYENIDKESPKLSDSATTMLRIYEAISASTAQ